MRFRWIPTTSDSVYPFLIGLLEFLQIEMLDPDRMGQWIILTAAIFGSMVAVSQFIMRRARLSGDNGAYFDDIARATIKDFYPQITVVILLIVGGVHVWFVDATGLSTMLLVFVIVVLMIQRYVRASKHWKTSIQEGAEF